MEAELLQRLGLVLPSTALPADVAPPVDVVAISLGVVIALGCLGVVVIVASVLVIRAIKKSHAAKTDV
jgi:hypothetical protein